MLPDSSRVLRLPLNSFPKMNIQAQSSLRKHDSFPAKREGRLPAMLERALPVWKTSLEEAFRGVTSDGNVDSSLFPCAESSASCASITSAASNYVSLLSDRQRKIGLFSLQAKEWRCWSNVHPYVMRHGLCLDDLIEEQRSAALAIVCASLSDPGFKEVRNVMRMSEHNRELTGRPEEYGEWFYWLSIMGTPSMSEPWGWQIDGHHLIMNCLVVRDQMVLSPVFLGAEPVTATVGKYAGMRVLQAEESAALAIIRSLSAKQRDHTIIGPTPPRDVIAGAFNDNLVLPLAGICYGNLTSEQQTLLNSLMGVYINRMRADQAAEKHAEVARYLNETYFCWMGGFDNDAPLYYRVHSPVLLIEFDHLYGLIFENDQPTRNHIHTIVRTPNGNDYGMALLADYQSSKLHKSGLGRSP
jgi:hypothetical protein